MITFSIFFSISNFFPPYKYILENNNISCEVKPSNIDEDSVKESLISENVSPEIISKNLAELKANKIIYHLFWDHSETVAPLYVVKVVHQYYELYI